MLLTRIDVASEAELLALEERLGRERTHRVDRRLCGFRGLDGAAVERPGRVFLLAAIARPERLARDVAAAHATIVGRAFFRDHHRFRAAELESVAARRSRRAPTPS